MKCNLLIKLHVDEFVRNVINSKNRRKLKNRNFSIISSNCNGGVMLHDLGMGFNSPFVNLWIKPRDYIRLLNNLKYYCSLDLSFVYEDGIDYPIGQIGDIKIYFQHYSSEKQAKDKWEERLKRMNWDNLFVLFTDRDGCTFQDMLEFDKIDYENKVIFTNKEYEDIESAFYIRGFEKDENIGHLKDFRIPELGIRYLDSFDYVYWLNGNGIKRRRIKKRI